MLKQLFALHSPKGASARLSTLIFHRVLAEPDSLFPEEIHARRFDQLCGWLASWFNVLPLDEAVVRLKAGSLPTCAACITFDDGYADNYHVALPILKRHGLPATFFIATGFLDGGRMWNYTIIEAIRACVGPELNLSSLQLGVHPLRSIPEKRAAITALMAAIKYQPISDRILSSDMIANLAQVQPPTDLMLTSAEVKGLHRAGMQIGAHTVSHPILAKLTTEQARAQILGSKDFLEKLLDERVGLFAYPNGKPGEDYTPQTVELVRNLEFDAAVSTQWGTSGGGDDPYQIRRFTPWDQTKLRFGARLLANLRKT